MTSAQSSTRPTPAAILPLSDVRREHVGSRIRVAGFITALDIENSLAILQHGEAGLLIDYCLCLSHEAIDDRSSGSSRRGAEYSKQYRTALPELKSKMMVMGELVHAGENTKSELSGGRDGIVPGILLQATLLKECIDLDLALWERAARVESQARWSEVEQRQRR